MSTVKSLPKYARVSKQIADRIVAGEFARGQQLPTERELINTYKVSYATLSRALRKLQDKGLIDRRWGHGTFVREAPPLSHHLAITFDDCFQATHPFVAPLIRSIGQGSGEARWHVQMFPLAEHRLFDGGPLERILREYLVGGVIGCSSLVFDDLKRLAELGVAFVSVNYQYEEASGIGCVFSDTAHAVEAILDHVTGFGHRKLALVSGPKKAPGSSITSASECFTRHWRDSLGRRGLPCPDHAVVHSDYRFESIQHAIHGVLSDSDGPTAIALHDDILAMHTIHLADSMGVRVPEDISIISVGDILHDSSLTSYRYPLESFGVAAVQQVVRLNQGQSVRPQYFKGQLQVRKTCGPVAGSQAKR